MSVGGQEMSVGGCWRATNERWRVLAGKK